MRAAPYKQDITTLVEAAIRAADPARLVARHLAVDVEAVTLAGERRTPSRLFLVSVGKAAAAMAGEAALRLGSWLEGGIVISKANKADHLPAPLRYFHAGHPIPTEHSVRATAAVKEMLATTRPGDLVLCLISGGTSALLTDPILPLPQWQELNEALLRGGCTINEVNTIRQVFDTVKGGGLAVYAAPAGCVSLILSDVIGNRLEHIGSGPTVPNEKDRPQARQILDRYDIWSRLDPATARAVGQHLEAAPQPATSLPVPPRNIIIGDIRVAVDGAARAATQLGFEVEVISTSLTGEAREIGRMAADAARAVPPGRCLLWGGESTVTVTGNGLGGRNQEIALAAAIALEGVQGRVVASFSTDAEDGPTPVAGAAVTGATVGKAAAKGLDAAQYLTANDSYHFFQKLGAGHLTAEIGTNVNDILLVLSYGKES